VHLGHDDGQVALTGLQPQAPICVVQFTDAGAGAGDLKHSTLLYSLPVLIIIYNIYIYYILYIIIFYVL
jgi:hypothetical protein